jgi:hypothetical protein
MEEKSNREEAAGREDSSTRLHTIMAEPEQSALFRTGNLLVGDGASASLAMKKKKRKKRNFLPSTAVSSLNFSASSSTPQSQAHEPNLNLTHENGIAPCADYLNSNIKPDVNLAIDCFDDTNNNDKKKKKKKKKSKSKKGLELEESWVVSPPGTRRSNGTDPNEIEEEKDCNKKKEKRRRKRNDSKCCELVKEEDRAFEFDKQKREPDYRIKSRIGPFDASLEDEILTLEDVLSRSIYKSNGTRTDLKNGQHDDEEEPNFSFKAVSNNPSIRAIDGCCNLAGEVEDEAVLIPSIYASLKEEKVQQNELEVGKAVGSKQRRRKEKQRTIAHADVRKVSPYFWRSTGQQEVRNDGNGRRFSPTRACAKAGATCVKVSPYFEKIPKEGENADVPNLNLTHENGIASCDDYFNSRKRRKINDIKRDVNLAINCYNDTNNNDNEKKKKKSNPSSSKKGLELEESWVVSPPGTRRSNGTDPNEVEEEKDCNKKKEKRRRKRNDSKCCELVKEEDRAFEFDKQKREPDYRIKSRIGPFDASLENEILTLEDVLSRSVYKSNGTRTDLKDGQHDDEEEPNFSFKAVSNNPSIRPIDGCCNLAGEVEDEAVIIPSIYASLKEEKVQQNELEVGKAVGSKQRQRKEKQRTIAHADVRKVSPYFWRSTGQQEVRNDGNGRRFSPTRACAKAGATCVKVSPYFEKIPKEGENADVPNLNLTHENGLASCDDYLNSRKRRKINDIKRDVNLAINCYKDTNNNDNNKKKKKKKSNPSSSKKGLELEESWVVPSSGTRCSYPSPTHDTAPNEIEEEKDCNKSKDKRRKRNDSNTDKRRRKRNDSKCCELMKEEDKAFEFDMQKRDPGYQMKSRIGPLDGSYENEVLKLEDVLSRSIYKSNGTRTNLKDGQHDDGEETTFSFKVTNNPSILAIDGGCNLAGEVEKEAVVIPSSYESLKEEVQQNELEIGKTVGSKRRRRNEKQQTIAHVNVRNVSPYFCRSTGQQEVRNDGNDRQLRPTKACTKARATSVKVSPYFQKMPKEEENADGLLLEGKNGCKTDVRVETVLSTSEKLHTAYRRKSPDNMWKPPRSSYGLLQEDHAHDPWRVLVICMLLNRTTGLQVFSGILCCFSLITSQLFI